MRHGKVRQRSRETVRFSTGNTKATPATNSSGKGVPSSPSPLSLSRHEKHSLGRRSTSRDGGDPRVAPADIGPGPVSSARFSDASGIRAGPPLEIGENGHPKEPLGGGGIKKAPMVEVPRGPKGASIAGLRSKVGVPDSHDDVGDAQRKGFPEDANLAHAGTPPHFSSSDAAELVERLAGRVNDLELVEQALRRNLEGACSDLTENKKQAAAELEAAVEAEKSRDRALRARMQARVRALEGEVAFVTRSMAAQRRAAAAEATAREKSCAEYLRRRVREIEAVVEAEVARQVAKRRPRRKDPGSCALPATTASKKYAKGLEDRSRCSPEVESRRVPLDKGGRVVSKPRPRVLTAWDERRQSNQEQVAMGSTLHGKQKRRRERRLLRRLAESEDARIGIEAEVKRLQAFLEEMRSLDAPPSAIEAFLKGTNQIYWCPDDGPAYSVGS